MKKQSFLLLFFPLMFAFSYPENPDTSCSAPTNVQVTAKSSGSVTFDWDDYDGNPNGYKVKYLRQSDGYTSPEYFTGTSDFTFSSLPAGRYTFYFKTDCGGEVSGIIIIEDLIIN